MQHRRTKSHFTCTLIGIFPSLFSQTTFSRHPWVYELQQNCTFTFMFAHSKQLIPTLSLLEHRLLQAIVMSCADILTARVPLPLNFRLSWYTPRRVFCASKKQNRKIVSPIMLHFVGQSSDFLNGGMQQSVLCKY